MTHNPRHSSQGNHGIERRDVLRLGAIGAGMAGLAPIVAGCSTPKAKSADGGTGPGFRGGALKIGVNGGSPKDTVDAHSPVDTTDIARVINLYETLTVYDADFRPQN